VPSMNLSPGNRFLGLTWDPSLPRPTGSVQSRLDALIAGWWRFEKPGLFLCGERDDLCARSGDIAICGAFKLTLDTHVRRKHDPTSMLELLRNSGEDSLANLASPLSVAWTGGGSATITGITDEFGIGQLFSGVTYGTSVLSNSAALLSRVLGLGLDLQALTGFALFGAFQENDTPFDGISKVPAAYKVRLIAGRREFMPSLGFRGASAPSANQTVAALAQTSRDVMVEMSDTFPDAQIELSGGVDTRMMLAALPSDRRRRHQFLTIGELGSEDVRVASEIASKLGLDHRIVDTAKLADVGADEIQSILERTWGRLGRGAGSFLPL
jgi:asparagine synthase (glutamine-hydrolysing)